MAEWFTVECKGKYEYTSPFSKKSKIINVAEEELFCLLSACEDWVHECMAVIARTCKHTDIRWLGGYCQIIDDKGKMMQRWEISQSGECGIVSHRSA